MKRNSCAYGLWIAINLLTPSCTMDAQSQESSDTLRSDGQNAFRAIIAKDVGVEQALGLVIQLRTERATLRLQYPDHQSVVGITHNDASDARTVFAREKERLTQIAAHFSADDPMEAPVKAALDRDLTLINSGAGPHAIWIDFTDGVNPHSPLIARFETFGLGRDDASNLGTTVSAITDWPQDAWWTPAGGTSTISTSGTLQKFWLDSAAKSAINATNSGVEMDTLIQGPYNATCGYSGVSSNMPDYYADTQASDNSPYRNCSVGTVSANQLQVGTLYWTWYPFFYFKTVADPYLTVQYQVKAWCPYVVSKSQCLSDKPWCMCDTAYQHQWLISYYYTEAPNKEKSWIKN